MKNSKRIVLILSLFLVVFIHAKAQPQRPPGSVADRKVSVILQRLQRSSNVFRGNLNLELINRHIDQTLPQNDINSFEPALESSINQFRENFNRRVAVTAEVQHILERAWLVNGFMARNRLNTRVQNDWASVRNDLNALAVAYGVSWQWNRQPLPAVNLSGLARMGDAELNELIQRIERSGDRFRSSLTDAFSWTPHTQATSEGEMNVAVLYFKNATDRLRNQFDAKQPVADSVARLIARATPIVTYMRNNALTIQAQTDWSAVRADLDRLAHAYDVSLS